VTRIYSMDPNLGRFGKPARRSESSSTTTRGRRQAQGLKFELSKRNFLKHGERYTHKTRRKVPSLNATRGTPQTYVSLGPPNLNRRPPKVYHLVDQASDLQTAYSLPNIFVQYFSYLGTSNKDVLVGRKLQNYLTHLSNALTLALWRE
jgi:hypothetical protein